MRRCHCGCTTFDVDVKQEIVCSASIDFEIEDEGDLSLDDHEDIISSDYDGPFICQECGEEYDSIEDIPLVDEETEP